MKQLIEDHELQDFIEVDSAGPLVGTKATRRMSVCGHTVQKRLRLPQQGTPVRKRDLDKFDYIIVMDSSNYTNVKSLASTKEQLDKIHMMTDYSHNITTTTFPTPTMAAHLALSWYLTFSKMRPRDCYKPSRKNTLLPKILPSRRIFFRF